jgi:hypothetical protein
MGCRFRSLVLSFASLAALLLGTVPGSAATSCEGLASLSLPHASITLAQSITGGSFTPPGSSTPLTGLPAFCRVAGTSTPTSDSIINFEVWIPTGSAFNGKYEQLGCGGFCGSIGYSSLAAAIIRGYAGAAAKPAGWRPSRSVTRKRSSILAIAPSKRPPTNRRRSSRRLRGRSRAVRTLRDARMVVARR